MITENNIRLQNESFDRYLQSHPDAQIPAGKLNCFALEDGRCTALSREWCKIEECSFYKTKLENRYQMLTTMK